MIRCPRGEDGALPAAAAVLPSSSPRSPESSRLWRVPPLTAGLVLLCAAVGAVLLAVIAAFALIPVMVTVVIVLGWLVALLLLGWGAIEALAALERWFENDPRFHR